MLHLLKVRYLTTNASYFPRFAMENLTTTLTSKNVNANPYDISLKESLEAKDGATKSAKARYPHLLDAPKRKVAMLMAYCGTDYYGLQCNRGNRSLPTIEGKLFEALAKAKVVPEICEEKPSQMKYASASRTDKGVSTCGQVVSLKLRFNEKTAACINEQLPHDIRVIDIVRVTQGFNAKIRACGRTYSYTMPTYGFADIGKNNKDYRITEDKIKLISSIMNKYKGTHSFHNFTSGKLMSDASAKRYIIDFWAEKPFLYNDIEFITLKVKGQSFVMHQIRKMIGMIIALVTGYAKEDHFERAFTEPLTDIPKAPGTGLVLMKVHYDAYNKQYEHTHGDLEWESSQKQLQSFYNEFIMPLIYKEEIENNCILSWLETLPNHDYTGKTSKIQWNEQLELKIKSDENLSNHNQLLSKENKEANIKFNREDRLKRAHEFTTNFENKEPTSKLVKVDEE